MNTVPPFELDVSGREAIAEVLTYTAIGAAWERIPDFDKRPWPRLRGRVSLVSRRLQRRRASRIGTRRGIEPTRPRRNALSPRATPNTWGAKAAAGHSQTVDQRVVKQWA
jgi:hypothetical protein